MQSHALGLVPRQCAWKVLFEHPSRPIQAPGSSALSHAICAMRHAQYSAIAGDGHAAECFSVASVAPLVVGPPVDAPRWAPPGGPPLWAHWSFLASAILAKLLALS